MLDSLVRARDTFLKPTTGLMMPSHATMLIAPICDEDERRVSHTDYANAMDDWREFADVTSTMYGVNMSVLEQDYDREQREYYVMSSRWAELRTGCLLADPIVVKELDMHICTVEDARGVGLDVGEEKGIGAPIQFDIVGRRLSSCALTTTTDNFDPTIDYGSAGPISGFAGWFTVDFKSRTDDVGKDVAPKISNPAYLSTGPEMGCEFLCGLLVPCVSNAKSYNSSIFCSLTPFMDRHTLGTAGVSSTKCHPSSARSDNTYCGYPGDDAHER